MDDTEQEKPLKSFHVVRQMEEDQRQARRDNEEHAKRAHDLNRQISNHCRTAAVDSANIAIRSLMLINGGAVVALLAFVGAIMSSDVGDSVKIDVLVKPIFLFAIGVGCAAIAALLAYVVNLIDAHITNSVKLTWDHPYVVDTKKATSLGCVRTMCHYLALAVVLAAIVAFLIGIFTVTQAISSVGL